MMRSMTSCRIACRSAKLASPRRLCRRAQNAARSVATACALIWFWRRVRAVSSCRHCDADVPLSAAASLPRDVAIAERGAREDADSTRLGPVALPAPAALEHLGPLVLGEHALKLQQQAVLGGVPNRAIEKDHLCAGSREFFQQEHLMRVAAGKAIRG